MKTHSMSIREFMQREPESKKESFKKVAKVAVPVAAPFTFVSHSYAAPAVTAVPANAAVEKISEETMKMLMHMLDPVIDLVVAMSLPICSLYILAACFYFLSSSQKALEKISKGAITYVVIQMFPIIQSILYQVGEAV
ncbi:hypothetical protein [Terribacillus sp. JSM ZJ617]|uniref:hypothetical protein n=1 Tax=Terribacillus sp. JSM ZJ617 TaxID=3342119 RepID=UPI0035A8BBE7